TAYHEVALDELVLVANAGLLGVVGRTFNLVVVVVESDDIDASEAGHLAGRTSDTASNIEDIHVLFKAHLEGKVVLVASNGLVEILTLVESTKVKRLSPSVLVE